jgi:DNA-binding winged helix-turn-helix (wHTH) protein
MPTRARDAPPSPETTGGLGVRPDAGPSRLAALSFGPFRLDFRSGQLLRGGDPVPLRPKTWSVLHYLAERPGELVSKREILDAVWPEVTVTEEVVRKSINELRAALGDSTETPRLIETVPRRGFRLIAEMQVPGSGAMVAGFGKDEPETRNQRPETPLFVGRAEELQWLTAALEKARVGERRCVFLTGEAGIGKTALVGTFLDCLAIRAARAPIWIARGACVGQHGAREAYLPVLAALERLVRRQGAHRLSKLLRRVAPTWLAQMPGLIQADDERALRRSLQQVKPDRMLREFAALVEALTTDVTLVLVLEDLHWSDASTVDLLWLLAQRREAARLLLIGTFRPADAIVREHGLMNVVRTLAVHRQCVDLALSPLREQDVRRYLRERFPGNDLPPALATVIHRHTDGNPLFMIGVVDHLLARGDILDTAPGWALRVPLETITLGVPDDVRLLTENGLGGLSPADRRVLQAASVAGEHCTAIVVAAALGDEVADVETRCEALAQASRFLRIAGQTEWPDGRVAQRYAFVHELYRRAVYEQIPPGQRTRLHTGIGQALETAYGARRVEFAPELAMHFERGHDGARALRYLTAAAERARLRFANREAAGYLEAALALLTRLPEGDARRRKELNLRIVLGAVFVDLHGFASEPVRDNLERAAQLCAAVGSAAQRFGVLYARWYLHAMRGDRPATAEVAAELEEVARRLGSTQHRVVAASVFVRTATYDGRFAEATRIMERQLGPATGVGSAGPSAEGFGPQAGPLRSFDRAQDGVGSLRPSKSDRLLHGPKGIAAPAFGPDPLLAATTHAAAALWFLGQPDGARAAARAAIAGARTLGHFFTLCAVLTQAALVELLCRNAGRGSELAGEAISLSVEHGFPFWNAMASMLTGWAVVQQGRPSEGSATIAAAIPCLEAAGGRFFLDFAYAFLAEGRLRAGALADGLDAVNAGLAMTETDVSHAYAPELWRLKGELIREQLNIEASKLRGRGRNGRENTPAATAQAEACFLRAIELARASEARSLELRAATSLARLWRTCGRTAEVRTLLGDVCRWFGAQTTSADLIEAKQLLRDL